MRLLLFTQTKVQVFLFFKEMEPFDPSLSLHFLSSPGLFPPRKRTPLASRAVGDTELLLPPSSFSLAPAFL